MRRFLVLAALLAFGLIGFAQQVTFTAQQAATTHAPVTAKIRPFPSCPGIPGPC
jgi:hypothetical protein